jgi:IS30 family transposase
MEQLPPSSEFTAILVIVDCLTKQEIFILTVNTINPKELALLFIMHIYSKHGSNHNTSDCGIEFISHFTCALREALNMCLHFTSSYHPEANGQAECTNQMLEQYICMYCNYHQDNWSTLLHLAEFTYNNILNVSTGLH